MEITVLQEAGHDIALRGMAYSFKDRAEDPTVWWEEKKERAYKRAPLLAPKEGGHNKFLESIQVWIDLEASRAFWSEFDTYRVGTTKQSESTMHTLSKRAPTVEDFEEGTHPEIIKAFTYIWENCRGDINSLKMNLPEGFLQRRIICTNYKVLKNIIAQREGHRLKWWNVFSEAVLSQVEHPEYLK